MALPDHDLLPFADSTDLADDPDRLAERFGSEGYIFLRKVIEPTMLFDLRARIVGICARADWFDPERDANDAVPWVGPRVEGEQWFFDVYDEIQKLEELHTIPHDPSVTKVMTALLGPTAFPHPLSIARLAFPHNEPWTTPAHQDYPNNQGTEDLYACWMPLQDCPAELGSLSILPGSHRLGVAPLEFSLGAGNRRARLDERFADLHWVGGRVDLGDVLVFHSCTVHRSLPNLTDRLRLSMDYRFQREGEALVEASLQPHFGRLSWEEIYESWTGHDIRYYWRNKDYEVAEWDPTFHQISEEAVADGYREWMAWRKAHPPLGPGRRRVPGYKGRG